MPAGCQVEVLTFTSTCNAWTSHSVVGRSHGHFECQGRSTSPRCGDIWRSGLASTTDRTVLQRWALDEHPAM